MSLSYEQLPSRDEMDSERFISDVLGAFDDDDRYAHPLTSQDLYDEVVPDKVAVAEQRTQGTEPGVEAPEVQFRYLGDGVPLTVEFPSDGRGTRGTIHTPSEIHAWIWYTGEAQDDHPSFSYGRDGDLSRPEASRARAYQDILADELEDAPGDYMRVDPGTLAPHERGIYDVLNGEFVFRQPDVRMGRVALHPDDDADALADSIGTAAQRIAQQAQRPR